MKWFKRIVLGVLALVLVVFLGGFGYALAVGRPPALRPDLVTPLPPGVPAAPAGYPSEYTAFAGAYLFHDLIPFGATPSVPGVVEKLDIEFGKGGDTPLLLDLYLPEKTTAPRPALLLFYGGGWTGGTKDQLRIYAQHYAQHGYVVATPQYRLREAGQWPNSVYDAKCAVRWMRAHAQEYAVDPNRIGVQGNSAGAYLALMVAYTSDVPDLEGDGGWAEQSSAVQAVADIYGPTDFCEPGLRDHPTLVRYMNGHYDDDPARYEKANPIRYVNAKTPPTCVITGTVDMLVPVRQSDRLVETLQKAGVPHLYSRLDGWPHVMDAVKEVNDHTKSLMLHFFDQHLAAQPPKA